MLTHNIDTDVPIFFCLAADFNNLVWIPLHTNMQHYQQLVFCYLKYKDQGCILFASRIFLKFYENFVFNAP